MNNMQFQRGAIDAGSCVSNGWEMLKTNYWVFFGMTALFVLGGIIAGCIPLVGGIAFQIFLAPPLTIGIFYALFRQMDGQPVDLGMMFKGFDKFGTAVIVGLIQSIPGIIWTIISFALNIGSTMIDILQKKSGRGYGSSFMMQSSSNGSDVAPFLAGGMLIVVAIVVIAALIFSIAWGVTFFFVFPLIAEHDIAPMDAIKLSFSAGWGNVGGIIVLFIFEFLLCLVGILALCIGFLFVLPIVYAANAFAYRMVFPWRPQGMNMAPPPPNEYGFTGGQQPY